MVFARCSRVVRCCGDAGDGSETALTGSGSRGTWIQHFIKEKHRLDAENRTMSRRRLARATDDQVQLRVHLSAGGIMLLFDLREPINALSHGVGMLLALPVTWVLWQRSRFKVRERAIVKPLGPAIALPSRQGSLPADFRH